jgi:hypothetical protein
VLAEMPGSLLRIQGVLGFEWLLYRWVPTLVLTLAVSVVFVLAHVLRAKAGATYLASDTALPFYLLGLYLLQPTPDLLQAGVLLGGAITLSLLLGGLPGLESSWPIPLLLFLVALIVYLCTLTPAVGTRDGYELQAISATLGFAHPTGYPLFPILGRAWISLFPSNLLGSTATIAWWINVLCALFAAASVPLVYGTAQRVLGRRSFAAWCALVYAFSLTLWTQASQPEKYTLNALFVSLILYVAFGTTDPEQRGPHPHLYWLAFLYGLSLTHHRTMLMLAPALALYLLWRDPHLLKRPREWGTALAIALAPLLVYLYIPWRAYAQGWAMTVPEFLRYISGAYYGPAVRLLDWLNPERVTMFWRFLVAQFGYVGIGLGILGLIGLACRRRWKFLTCTVLAYTAYYFWGTVWYAYYNDVNSFIPNHMLFAIWIGSGALVIWKAVEPGSQRAKGAHRIVLAVFWSLAALLPMWMLWTNARQVDMSDVWSMTRWGEHAIGLPIAPDATILADREKYPPLDYFARIEKRRPDIDVVILGDERAYLDRLAWDMAHGKPVYLARFLPGLEGRYHLGSLGPLVEVSAKPLAEIDDLEGSLVVFGAPGDTSDSPPRGARIDLLGYHVEDSERDSTGSCRPGSYRAGDPLRITLFWRPRVPIPGNYQVRLRLVGPEGQEWWTSSDHPVSGMYPTASWREGEIVSDWHEVPIDETLPPGNYTLQVGLFPPFSDAGLPCWPCRNDASGGHWAPLQAITVAPTQIGIPQRMRAVAPGKVELLGYDLARQAPPSGRVPLTLYWQALAPLPDYEIGTRLVTKAGEQEWTWSVPGNGEYPVSLWPTGETVATTHVLAMPAEGEEAKVQIAVQEPGEEPLFFYPRWLAPQTTTLSLPPIVIVGRPPATPGTVNFADQILLLGTDLGQRALPAGAPLDLTTHWQGMQAMEADYTLFIHILAPDGTLQGQIDVWPRDGTHPTSQWREGEVVEDHYLLYVDPSAPPGDYQVEIGWYLLETMQRLPVLDAEGKAIDDKVLLPGLTIQPSEPPAQK